MENPCLGQAMNNEPSGFLTERKLPNELGSREAFPNDVGLLEKCVKKKKTRQWGKEQA